MLFAASGPNLDLSLAVAAVPTSIAAIVVGWFTYRAARSAAPVVKEAAAITPAADPDRAAGWLAAMEAKDETIDLLRTELADCRTELGDLRASPGP